MAAGHGGQILLADSTAVLLSGVDLIDLGPRRLRDVPTPVQVFQVQAPGLRTDFPALRTLDPSPGNLRPQTTSFIGRESELDELKTAVKAHRLMTLTGVGGVGKTRLALEVAARLADEFPDGVWFFELAAVADPAAMPDAVAAVLGITQQPGKTVSESIAAALEGRLRLLVIDNCEHVLDAAADLHAIGDRAGRCHEPRRTRGRPGASVASTLAGHRRGNRLSGGDPVHRTRSRHCTELRDSQRR
jgi:hypothetical protein